MATGKQKGASVRIADISSAEFARRLTPTTLVILPVGATEEHGRHLPLATDTLQAEWAAEEVAKAVKGLVAPPVEYGLCNSTRNFPGTVSISFDTVRHLGTDIIEDLHRNGARRIMVLSGHAGSQHMAALKLAAEDVARRHADLRVAVLSDYDFAYDLRGKDFPAEDGHGGTLETSRVLALHPRLVKGRTKKSYRRPPKFHILPDAERHFPSGIIGDPTIASGKLGHRVNRYVLEKLVALAREI